MQHHVVYASTATRPLSRPELRALVIISRRNNVARHLGGMLLHQGGNFIQVLEGERDLLKRVIERIGADARHKDMRILIDEPLATRAFADVPLGFLDLDQPPATTMSDTTPATLRIDAGELRRDPAAALTLLRSLRGVKS